MSYYPYRNIHPPPPNQIYQYNPNPRPNTYPAAPTYGSTYPTYPVGHHGVPQSAGSYGYGSQAFSSSSAVVVNQPQAYPPPLQSYASPSQLQGYQPQPQAYPPHLQGYQPQPQAYPPQPQPQAYPPQPQAYPPQPATQPAYSAAMGALGGYSQPSGGASAAPSLQPDYIRSHVSGLQPATTTPQCVPSQPSTSPSFIQLHQPLGSSPQTFQAQQTSLSAVPIPQPPPTPSKPSTLSNPAGVVYSSPPYLPPMNADAIAVPQETQQPSSQRTQNREPSKEFYDLEWKNNLIVRLAPNEVIDHLFDVSESSYYGKNPCYIAVSNRRLILITGDLKGGVYWPLKTTRAVRVETGKMLSKWSRFVFISTVANSAERYVQFEDKKDASIVETIFNANVELKEYSTVFIKNRNNALAVFNEECNTVVRFSKALKVCSQNLKAMFIWLMSMESYLPLVKQQLRAAANTWAKSTMGNNAMDDIQMLDIITQGSDEESYYQQMAMQIAHFLTSGQLMKTYGGTIPLLDAYYYYGRATANDLKSPEDFLRACRLLTQSKASENHVYLGTIKGKEVLCSDVPIEELETTLLNLIDNNNGCIAKNALIRKLGLPIAVCDDLITKIETNGKIVRDSSSTDIFYYRNAFALVKTKLITDSLV